MRPIINVEALLFKPKHKETFVLWIDKQFVSQKSNSSMKQYNPKKPQKHEFKFYVFLRSYGHGHNLNHTALLIA